MAMSLITVSMYITPGGCYNVYNPRAMCSNSWFCMCITLVVSLIHVSIMYTTPGLCGGCSSNSCVSQPDVCHGMVCVEDFLRVIQAVQVQEAKDGSCKHTKFVGVDLSVVVYNPDPCCKLEIA